MVEVLFLLLAYGLLLDCAPMNIQRDVGQLPSVLRRRALAGLVRRRPRAAVLLRPAPKASRDSWGARRVLGPVGDFHKWP